MSHYSYNGPKRKDSDERVPVVAAQPGAEPPPSRRRELLTEATRRFLESLPAGVSMARSARDFPHVVNKLADAWSNYWALETLMDRLLIDERAHREGFPPPVIMELDALRHYRSEMNARAR